MKAFKTWVFLVLSCVITIGCAPGMKLNLLELLFGPVSKGPELIPIKDHTQRLELTGLSILPPAGENWFMPSGMGQSQSIILLKKFPEITTQPAPSVFVAVNAGFVDEPSDGRIELLRLLKEQMEKEMKAGFETVRHRVISSKTSLDDSLGSDCFRYDATVEDRGVPQFPGSVFMMTMRGFICLHPDMPRLVINMLYSQRTLQGSLSMSLESEADSFLKSIRFSPIQVERPAVVATLAVGHGPQMLAVSGNEVWVTQIKDNMVAKIDSRTNSVVAEIPVGKEPVGVAVSEGAVWVANQADASVSRINPITNSVVSIISVGRSPLIIAVSENAVWVTNRQEGTVSRINPQTNQVEATIPVGSMPSGVAVDKEFVWITNFGDATVSKIDPITNQVVGKPIPVGRRPGFITVSDGTVWVANQEDATVSRIDPQSNMVTAAIPVGRRASGLALGGGAVWVTNFEDGNVSKIDPQTNKVTGKSIQVGGKPLGIAFGKTAVWVANFSDDSISRIEP